jgi:hypothetical protein
VGRNRHDLVRALAGLATRYGWVVVAHDAKEGWVVVTLHTDDEADPEED